MVTYARSQTNPASTVYAYYDMDGNGVDELVFAFKPGNVFKDYMITDIYAISKDDGQVIRLTDGLQLGMSVSRQAVVQVTTLIMTASLLSKTTVIQVLKKQIFLVGIGRI